MNSNDTMNLSGAWKMADFDPGQGEPAGAAGPGFDDGEWLPATVPGDVHTSLLTLGEIPDPFYDYNVEQQLITITDPAGQVLCSDSASAGFTSPCGKRTAKAARTRRLSTAVRMPERSLIKMSATMGKSSRYQGPALESPPDTMFAVAAA